MMEGIGARVEIVVKAANQQSEDVKILVDSAWTIRDLKAHLSEIYPTKPRMEEQKIIYSGQLLKDSAALKDVLRVYEGQASHTVHLVCTPTRYQAPTPVRQPPASVPTAPAESEGLRRRNVAPETSNNQPTEAPRPEMRQNDQNHTAEMQNYYGYMMANMNRVPPMYADQQMRMWQAYAEYMRQTADMWRAAGVNEAVPPVNPVNEAPVQEEEAVREAAVPRDWLDWVYAICRIAMLGSMLYLYSSPMRLALVMLLAVAWYLYQIGFFQAVGAEGRQNDEPAPQARPAPQPPAPAAADNAAADVNTTDSPTETRPSVLGTTWMLFISFFTSIIPETPNVI